MTETKKPNALELAIQAAKKQAQPTLEQATPQEGPKIDESTKYRLNAGKCDKCGNFKTWDFKILNEKTGKQVPGHVTKDGFKIDDGDCPYWSALRKGEKPAAVQAEAPAPAMPRDDAHFDALVTAIAATTGQGRDAVQHRIEEKMDQENLSAMDAALAFAKNVGATPEPAAPTESRDNGRVAAATVGAEARVRVPPAATVSTPDTGNAASPGDSVPVDLVTTVHDAIASEMAAVQQRLDKIVEASEELLEFIEEHWEKLEADVAFLRTCVEADEVKPAAKAKRAPREKKPKDETPANTGEEAT